MENLNMKIKHTQEVESEISIPPYFTLNNYNHYKLLSNSAVIMVNYYTDKLENITSLELFPCIEVHQIFIIPFEGRQHN